MHKNENSTRFYSTRQENAVADLIRGYRTANSGAGKFSKLDVIQKEASIGIECKTPMTEKDSFSIKKDWIVKSKEEAFAMRLSNVAVAFTFAPDTENFFVIDEKLMQFLIEKLEEEYKF